MTKVKTNVPIVNMDEQTYKLSDFVEEFKKIELKELKTENKVNNLPKNVLIRNKKVFYIILLKILFILHVSLD